METISFLKRYVHDFKFIHLLHEGRLLYWYLYNIDASVVDVESIFQPREVVAHLQITVFTAKFYITVSVKHLWKYVYNAVFL